jgi:two-component system, OmpR family, KDP operon response regulator KdpE
MSGHSHHPAGDDGHPRLLLVEDDPQIVRALLPGLRYSGHDVCVAGTGAEARASASDSAPDIAIIDIGLPDLDGKELIGDFAGVPGTAVIVISARDSVEERRRALELGARAYLLKPFGVGELVASISAALSQD